MMNTDNCVICKNVFVGVTKRGPLSGHENVAIYIAYFYLVPDTQRASASDVCDNRYNTLLLHSILSVARPAAEMYTK